jgi:hypothetical protein
LETLGAQQKESVEYVEDISSARHQTTSLGAADVY